MWVHHIHHIISMQHGSVYILTYILIYPGSRKAVLASDPFPSGGQFHHHHHWLSTVKSSSDNYRHHDNDVAMPGLRAEYTTTGYSRARRTLMWDHHVIIITVIIWFNVIIIIIIINIISPVFCDGWVKISYAGRACSSPQCPQRWPYHTGEQSKSTIRD